MYNTDINKNSNLVDSMTIKVETTKTDDYHRINQICNNGYTFIVDSKDAGKAIVLIIQLHNKYNLPCERVYPTQWKNINKDYVWSLEKITQEIEKMAINLGTIEQESVKRK